jgi:hypothetical protein
MAKKDDKKKIGYEEPAQKNYRKIGYEEPVRGRRPTMPPADSETTFITVNGKRVPVGRGGARTSGMTSSEIRKAALREKLARMRSRKAGER